MPTYSPPPLPPDLSDLPTAIRFVVDQLAMGRKLPSPAYLGRRFTLPPSAAEVILAAVVIVSTPLSRGSK